MLLVFTDNIESDTTSGKSLAYRKVSEKTYALNVFPYLDIFFLHPSHQSMEATYPPHSYSKESELHQKNYLIENMKTVQESTMCHKF